MISCRTRQALKLELERLEVRAFSASIPRIAIIVGLATIQKL